MNGDGLDDLDPGDTRFTVPLIGGDAAAIKQLANNTSVKNLGESRRLDWQSQNRPPHRQSGVAKLHAETLVQQEVWTWDMHGHAKRTRERPRINRLLSDQQIRDDNIGPASAQGYATLSLQHGTAYPAGGHYSGTDQLSLLAL